MSGGHGLQHFARECVLHKTHSANLGTIPACAQRDFAVSRHCAIHQRNRPDPFPHHVIMSQCRPLVFTGAYLRNQFAFGNCHKEMMRRVSLTRSLLQFPSSRPETKKCGV